MLNKDAKKIKQSFEFCSLDGSVASDEWLDDGILPALSRNAKLLVNLVMFQKKRSLLEWKDYRVHFRKYLEHERVWLFFQSTA